MRLRLLGVDYAHNRVKRTINIGPERQESGNTDVTPSQANTQVPRTLTHNGTPTKPRDQQCKRSQVLERDRVFDKDIERDLYIWRVIRNGYLANTPDLSRQLSAVRLYINT
jgi:hypothetical protein